MANTETKLALYSRLAFYPMHWEAFTDLCTRYKVSGTVIANTPPDLPSVHKQLGQASPDTVPEGEFRPNVYIAPAGSRSRQSRWLCATLSKVKPDAIWVQEEPTDYFLFEILRFYFLDRHPRIVTAVCENIFVRDPIYKQLPKQVLWSRLNGLAGVAMASIQGIQAVGMPARVPAVSLVAGALPPPPEVEPLRLPFEKAGDDFVICFVGRLVEQKGWRVLLAALTLLPQYFKLIIAGDGEQLAELMLWAHTPALENRVYYLGLFPKHELWRVYRASDCVVLPSIDVPYPKEQFGGVLADGMALGRPVIGSAVGGMPEVIGPAGLVVPPGDPQALAAALKQIQNDPTLRQELGEEGMRRFWAEFAIPAYADKLARMLGLVKR